MIRSRIDYLKELGVKTASLDFEFRKSEEPHPELLCCSIVFEEHIDQAKEYWLLEHPARQEDLVERIKGLHASGFTLIAHAANAEARCLSAMGINPTWINWIDTYLERKQLTNKCDKFSYGMYFDKNGEAHISQRPSFQSWKNHGKDNLELRCSLHDTVGRHLEVCVDSKEKDECRDLILSGRYDYSPEEIERIMTYCTSDVVYLYPLANKLMEDGLSVLRKFTPKMYLNAMYFRGQFAADTSTMEDLGYPVVRRQLLNLIDNYDLAKDDIIAYLVENYFPFYVKEKTKGHIAGTWKKKYDKMVEFIHSKGLQRTWPKNKPNSKSPQGSYKTDEDTLKEYNHIKEIAALLETNKQVSQLKWFRPDGLEEGEEGFFDHLGSDDCVRHFHNTYGTQTSRNAPPAKQFILAMSSWLRSVIVPPEGEVIIGCDWSSQEFAGAAILSGDPQMMAAYQSGDPYLYFAKMAGAVPKGADPKLCKNPAKVWDKAQDIPESIDVYHPGESDRKWLSENYPELYAEYDSFVGYSTQRALFKSTTLGLQYGMGFEKLAVKITLDTGIETSPAQAKRLVGLHKKLFRVMWDWQDSVIKKYKHDGAYTLWDGWSLLGDNDNDLSVKNFPVQGTGAVTMRRAVHRAIQYGVKVMCPLHDAIYARCKDDPEVIEQTVAALHKAMDEACSEVLGDVLKVRIDTDVHRHTDVWIEDKGRNNYERLGKYLEPISTSKASQKKILKKFFSQVGGKFGI